MGEHSSYTRSVSVAGWHAGRPILCCTHSMQPSHCDDAQFFAQSQWHQEEHRGFDSLLQAPVCNAPKSHQTRIDACKPCIASSDSVPPRCALVIRSARRAAGRVDSSSSQSDSKVQRGEDVTSCGPAVYSSSLYSSRPRHPPRRRPQQQPSEGGLRSPRQPRFGPLTKKCYFSNGRRSADAADAWQTPSPPPTYLTTDRAKPQICTSSDGCQ